MHTPHTKGCVGLRWAGYGVAVVAGTACARQCWRAIAGVLIRCIALEHACDNLWNVLCAILRGWIQYLLVGAESREERGMIVNLKPSGILHQNREMIRSVALKHHTQNPRVFGSVLSGEDERGSDLDLLVEPMLGTTLFDLGAIQIELEEALGITVDVLTPGDLPAKFRDQVLRDAVPV